MNELEKLLRDDLRDVAATVDIPVSLDAVATERDRLDAGDRRARRLRWGLAAAALALLVAGALWWAQTTLWRVPDTAVPNPLQTPTAPTVVPTPTSAPSSAEPTASASATPPGERMVGMYVYYMTWESGGSLPNLVRELKQVPAATPARGALDALLAGPADPDYVNPWNAGTRVLGIAKHGDVITVDLSKEALVIPYGVSGEGWMIDTLVWTVTEAFAPTDRVLITVEGHTFETGHNVYDRPLSRGDNTPMRIVIDTPVNGATVDSPVHVTGLAATFEAVLHWKVTGPDGAEAATGTAMTAEGMTLSPFAFDLPSLAPGTYTLTVETDDPSGGEGFGPTSDTKEFTVR